jgi:hypothetical protein
VESAWGAVPALLLVRFPGRSPNPACDFHRTGLSMVSAVGWFRQHRPRVGDLVSPVAVPGDGYRFGVEQLDPVRADGMPPAGVVGEPATDVLPLPAVPGPHHPHDPPPDEVLELASGAGSKRYDPAV